MTCRALEVRQPEGETKCHNALRGAWEKYMNKTLKRVIAGITGTALACGGIVGGLYAYKGMNRTSVSVYPVSALAQDSYYFDMFGTGTGYGTVEADRMQNVTPSSTMQVREILVKEGQEVKKGDPLLTYDTTLKELDIERAENLLEQKKLALQQNEKALKIIKGLSPTSVGDDSYTYPDYTEAEPTPTPTPEPLGPEMHPQLIDGEGTDWSPYVYLWGADDILSDDLLIQMAMGKVLPAEKTDTEEATSEEQGDSSTEENKNDQEENQTNSETAPAAFISWFLPIDVFAEEVDEASEVSYDSQEDSPSVTPSDDGGQETAADTEYSETNDTEIYDEDTEVADVTGTDEAKTAVIDPDVSSMVESSEEDSDAGTYSPVLSYIRLECHESNNREGSLLFQWSMVVSRDSYGNIRVLPYRSDYTGTSPEGSGEETSDSTLSDVDSGDETIINDEGDGVYYGGSDYTYTGDDDLTADTSIDAAEDYSGPFTAAEIKAMLTEKELQVRDDTLEVKIQELSLKQMKEEYNGDTIKAKTDGVVTAVNDMDIVNLTGDALITISGSGGGYYLKFTVSELYLDSLSVGSTVKATDYSTDMEYEAEITEITYYPASGDDYYSGWSEGNQNVSYYPCRARIDGTGISEYAFCGVNYDTNKASSTGNYLSRMFIRRDGAAQYVYVRGDDGKLVRRNVVLGNESTFDSSSVEIRSGLSEDDWIAFPYGTDVKEGARTEESDLESLYAGYM